MFKLNLKIAFRNLIKNRVYTAINIGGLALGLTGFVLLLLYINHENSYDRWDQRIENVYQIREFHNLSTPDNKPHWQELNNSRNAAMLKKSIPQFKYVTKVDNDWGDNYSIKTELADPLILKGFVNTDSLFFKVFSYKFLQGNENNALQSPNSLVLKHSTAKLLFGTDEALGKTVKMLTWQGDPGTTYTVTGVVEDPSVPESLKFNAIMHNGEREKDPENLKVTTHCKIYGLVNTSIDTNALNRTINSAHLDYKNQLYGETQNKAVSKGTRVPSLKIIPLKDVHANPPFARNWIDKVKPVVALSIFLLLISVINFINLATAQSVQRAKEVGVKKVLGTSKNQLIWQFLLEAAIQSMLALFVSIALVELLLPAFSSNFDVQLSFWHNTNLVIILLQLLSVFIIVTLLAGLYPAAVLSNYNPIAVLKGNYENSFKGIALRNGLVILQFAITATFIISIGVMQSQTNFLVNKDLGFDRSHLINISTNYNDQFAKRIKKIPGVEYVATTTQVMGNTFNVSEKVVYKNNTFDFNTVTVTMETLPALGVQLVSGRLFSKEYKQDTINTVVLNEAAAKLLGGNIVGQDYDVPDEKKKYTFRVVGVIKDYNNEGFDKTVLPTVYKVTHLGGMSSTNNLIVRFNTDNYQHMIESVRLEWAKIYPDFPMIYTSGEDAFQAQILSDKRFMKMITIFSAFSILLSLLGLFTLSAFVSKRRTKEIAVRKVLGASNLQIVNMLNRSFLVMIIVANLISWPVAYIIMNKWLQGFAYRVDMPFAPFVIATVISLIIALFTVSIQARKAAVSNPVKALKYE